jgi:hypothetical protein
MPDPTGANLTDAEVTRIEFAEVHFQDFKLADRLQEIRKDQELGTIKPMSLTLTAAHTLVEPGGTVGADSSEITGSFIIATADGAYNLKLPDPTKFSGRLHFLVKNGSSAITVHCFTDADASSGKAITADTKSLLISDGTSWFAEAIVDPIADLT